MKLSKEIQYLGHVLGTTGIKPLPSKTAAIKLMKSKKNAKQVRAFLRLVGYYCKFIKKFAQIANPLTALTHHDARFVWTSVYIVYTDALDDAFGAQLSQEHDGQELSVAFFSCTFTDIQQKWSTTEQEV